MTRRLIPFLLALIMVLPVAASAAVAVGTPLNASAPQTSPTSGGTPLPASNSGNDSSAGNSDSQTTLSNPLKNITSLQDLLMAVINALIQIGVIVLTIAIIWSGFMFIRAQGRAEELKKARTSLMWTLIGGLILLGAKGIAVVIQNTVSNL